MVEAKAAPRCRGMPKKSCRDQLSSPVHQQQVPMYSALCFDGARPTAFPSAATILLPFSHHTYNSYHGTRYVVLPRCEEFLSKTDMES